MTSVNLAGNIIDCLRDEGGIFSPGYDYFCQRLTGSLICTVKTHDGVLGLNKTLVARQSRNADENIPMPNITNIELIIKTPCISICFW